MMKLEQTLSNCSKCYAGSL